MGVAQGATGLLGGSFDPVHYGHLQLASDALKHLPLAEVRFLPAAQPWQKGAMTAAEHRAKMVQLAIEGEPRFVLDMREIERGGTTYTIDTLRDLRNTDPSRPLVLIMGSDQFDRRQTWHQWQQVGELAHIAVAQRAGVTATPVASNAGAGQVALTAGGCTVQFPMTPIDVSATEVRRLLRDPHSTQSQHRLAAMVPGKVLDYIRLHNLYRNS